MNAATGDNALTGDKPVAGEGAGTGRGRCEAGGKVWFIGAGPGDPELLTVKGRRLISEADLVLYAGSLVPPKVVACARLGAQVADSSHMTLEETHAMMREVALAGGLVARVHTGDPSLYGATREQMQLLDAEGIPYGVVPGVTAAFAAAAAACVPFTVPEVTQSLVITRLEGRTSVPERERLQLLAAHGCAMAIYLSAAEPEKLREELLTAGFAPETCVLVAHRVGWPDGSSVMSSVDGLADTVRSSGFTRQTIFLVLPGETTAGAASRLYAAEFTHGWRKGTSPSENMVGEKGRNTGGE